MQNVGKKKITQENVLNEFKNRLIFENVLQKTRKRYELSKELNAENNDFKFINETAYNSNYFKPIPVDEMLYSILMNNNVYTKLVNPLMDDINIIDEYIATMQKSQKHMEVYTLLLINSIAKYVGKVTKSNLFNLYVATIYNFLSKYDYHNISSLEWLMNKVMGKLYMKKIDLSNLDINKISTTIILNSFSQINAYIYLEGIENGDLKINPKKATLVKTKDMEISFINQIYENCFSFIDKVDYGIFNNSVNLSSIKEYVQIVGIEYYKNYVQMIIDELPVVDEIELDFRFTTFITSNKYCQVLDADTFEQIAIEFAKRGLLNDDCLETLKKMKSKYVDKYLSYMVLDEIK